MKNKKRIANRLLKAFERYILLQSLEQDPVLSNLLIAQFYLDHRLQKHANHNLKKAEQENDKRKNRFFNFYHYRYWLAELRAAIKKHDRKPIGHSLTILPFLEKFYLIQKVRILLADLTEYRILSKAEQEKNKDASPSAIRNKLAKVFGETDTPEVLAYKPYVDMINNKNDENAYQKVKEVLENEQLKFNLLEQKELIEGLMNFCTGQANLGKKNYASDYIYYVSRLEEMGKLLDGGRLGLPIFRNTVAFCIISNQLERADNFVNEKSKYLEESSTFHREPFVTFMRAYIALYKNELEQCLDLINKFMNSDMYSKISFNKMSADKIMIKALFLSGQVEAVHKRLPSVERYIKK